LKWQRRFKVPPNSVIPFLSAKDERPADIHKQIVAVYGEVMNRRNVTKRRREFPEGKTGVHDEQMICRPYLISDDLDQKIEGENHANRYGTIKELDHIIPEVSKTSGVPRIFFGGGGGGCLSPEFFRGLWGSSTNSVGYSGQGERGSRVGTPLVRGSTQFANK
jgi:hypothetical protein